MPKHKHTPGPWEKTPACGMGHDKYVAVRRTETKVRVAEVEARQGKEADADLIAAAPDLLAALEDLIDEADEYLHDDPYGDYSDEDWAVIEYRIGRARKAIADAKGEEIDAEQ